MTYATRQNSKEGDVVLVPLNNEFWEDEPLCQTYEIVTVLKLKGEQTVVPVGQEPLPEYLPFTDEMAYLIT